MRYRTMPLIFIFICMIFPDASRCQSNQQTGELQIYSFPTQIGTAAKRTFQDDKGRVNKEIYYTPKTISADPPYTEDMLRVQSIVLYKYDDRGREIKSEHYDPGMNLQYKWETTYDDNKGRRKIKYTREGIRTYEIRFVENRSLSHLYYDERGENLVAIQGMVPQDIDIPFGWGEPVDGLACGIASTKIKSPIDDASVYAIWVNIKNVGSKNISFSQLPTVEMELRDSFGTLVWESTQYANSKGDALQKRKISFGRLLYPGESGPVYPYELRTRYGKLAPGSYSIRVKQPIDEKGVFLVSNTIHFEIKG
jgi:hypothetical protein